MASVGEIINSSPRVKLVDCRLMDYAKPSSPGLHQHVLPTTLVSNVVGAALAVTP